MAAKQIIILVSNSMNLRFHLCPAMVNEVHNMGENRSSKAILYHSKIMTSAYAGLTKLSGRVSNRLQIVALSFTLENIS